jgi:hypothetical protein
MIQISRAQFNSTFIDLLTGYLNGDSCEQLLAWVNRRRARCIDFSVKVPSGSHGTTVLHEAARRKDQALLQACHDQGADLLVRDAKGRAPTDFAKDDKIRAWFRQGSSSIRFSTVYLSSMCSHDGRRTGLEGPIC